MENNWIVLKLYLIVPNAENLSLTVDYGDTTITKATASTVSFAFK